MPPLMAPQKLDPADSICIDIYIFTNFLHSDKRGENLTSLQGADLNAS